MIANGGSMKFGGHCENVCLRIGGYSLKWHIFSFKMGHCDIVLGIFMVMHTRSHHHGLQGDIYELPIGWESLHFPQNHN